MSRFLFFLTALLAPAMGKIKVVGNCKCDPMVSRSQMVKCAYRAGQLVPASTSDQPLQHSLEYKCIATGTHDGANCECCDCGVSAARSENGVLVLTEENFDDVVNGYGRLFIHYYSPWCVHCKDLARELEATARKLADAEPPMRLARST